MPPATTTTIYDPPNEGLPYLVVTFSSDGMHVATANSTTAARTLAADRAIKRRRDRLNAGAEDRGPDLVPWEPGPKP